MIRRGLLIVLLAGGPGVAVADEPARPPDSCPNDLLTTAEYAALIRAQRDALRDTYEVEIARLRARVKVLETDRARGKADAAVTKPGNIP